MRRRTASQGLAVAVGLICFVPTALCADWVEFYRARYGLKNLSDKITDNRGNGTESLYGTRNLRVVMHGILYRSGGNNYYHRTQPRNNMNPMPIDGLNNLCNEGFGVAIYNYETGYQSAPKILNCKSPRSERHVMRYLQQNPLVDEGLYTILKMVHETIGDYRHGPILTHCWNGWHASGWVATAALMQFCGLGSEQAVAYWNKNTDGNDKGESYDKIRAKIRAFKPYPELAISAESRAKVCPSLDQLIADGLVR